MAALKTSYMGIELKNPVIVGACSMTSNMGSIKKIEDQGAAALVFPSLFEEQIELERMKLEEELQTGSNLSPEMINIFPELEHAGPAEHLVWVRKAKESVGIPVFASLNAINRETWGTVRGVVEFFESTPFASLFAAAILLWLLSLRFK